MAELKRAYDIAYYGWAMHLAAAAVWLLLGLFEISEYFRQGNLMTNPPDTGVPAGISSDSVFLALVLGILFIIFALVALVWSVLIRWKILDAINRQEYEYAARNIMLLGALGLLFGLGGGGALLLLSLVRMKETLRSPASTAAPAVFVAQATPICPNCGHPARFIHGEQRWHCDNCALYL